MPRDIVVIGGSAGALQPLIRLVQSLPRSLPASVFVVLHTSAEAPGALPLLLEAHLSLTASYAADGEAVRPGHVYVAAVDHHLLLEDGHVRVVHGPRENGFRPAIDPLFRTAARSCGARVVGVVLSGALDDGTNGLAVIKRHGGIAVVQHPDDAEVEHMPLSAVRNVEVDHIVPADGIAAILRRYAAEPESEESGAMPKRNTSPPDPVEGNQHGLEDGSLSGPPSGFVCPECSGALWELKDGAILRFACHVGHSFSMQTLLNGKTAQLEPVLWTALRALEEQAAILRRVAERAEAQNLETIAAGYRTKAEDTESRATVLRDMLLAEPIVVPGVDAAAAPLAGLVADVEDVDDAPSARSKKRRSRSR